MFFRRTKQKIEARRLVAGDVIFGGPEPVTVESIDWTTGDSMVLIGDGTSHRKTAAALKVRFVGDQRDFLVHPRDVLKIKLRTTVANQPLTDASAAPAA